jgi:hypothetical protein
MVSDHQDVIEISHPDSKPILKQKQKPGFKARPFPILSTEAIRLPGLHRPAGPSGPAQP